MLTIKAIHVFCAYLTGIGFLLRGILAIQRSTLLQHRLLKIAPHIIDTVLLICGLIMAIHWSLTPANNPWLIAKIIALFFYIGFGLLMLRWGSSSKKRWLGLIGGLTTYLYIIAVAHSKSILFFFT